MSCGDRAQIASLRRRVDLHDRQDVVLGNDRIANRARDLGEAAENLRASRRRRPRSAKSATRSSVSSWYCGVCMTIE